MVSIALTPIVNFRILVNRRTSTLRCDSRSIYRQIPLISILLASIISIIIWFPNPQYILGRQCKVPSIVQKYKTNNGTCYHSLNACFLTSIVINALHNFIHLTFTTIIRSRYYSHPHFSDKKTIPQRVQ